MEHLSYKLRLTILEFFQEFDAKFSTPFVIEENLPFSFVINEIGIALNLTVNNVVTAHFFTDTMKLKNPVVFEPTFESAFGPAFADDLNFKSIQKRVKVYGYITKDMGNPFTMQLAAELELITVEPDEKQLISKVEDADDQITEINKLIIDARGFKR